MSALAYSSVNTTLDTLARASGRRFGCAVRLDSLFTDMDFAAAIWRECAQVTPELALKWARLEPRPDELAFLEMDALATLARNHGKMIRGHTLLWHLSLPEWVASQLMSQRDWRVVARHFASVIPRYGDVVGEWDVVNEPIDPDAGPEGLRATPLLAAFGPDYICRALREARLMAPRARLLINEFGLEYETPDSVRRRAVFLRLLERLKRQGAPLDGVGLQSHLDLGKGMFRPSVYGRFLQHIADMGYSIAITEFDVRERDYLDPPDLRDAKVAEAAGDFLSVALDQYAVKSVTCWGLSDRYSWLDISKQDLARFPGAWRDGSSPGLNRGLPLDSNLAVKPLYNALARSFRAARKIG